MNLTCSDVSTKITMDRARCLLIDFDNAALTEPIPPTSETTDDEPLTVDAAVIGKELAERTVSHLNCFRLECYLRTVSKGNRAIYRQSSCKKPPFACET